MVQNTMRALPGSLSGGRSTIAEYSARSRGIMGLAMQDFLLIMGTFSRRCSYVQPDAMYRKTLTPFVPAKAATQDEKLDFGNVAVDSRLRGNERSLRQYPLHSNRRCSYM